MCGVNCCESILSGASTSGSGERGEARKGELEVLADDELVVLVGDVALDLALVDEVAEYALAHVVVHVGLALILEYVDEGLDGYLGRVEETRQRLEQVAVGGHLELLEEQVDAVLDEELLVLAHVRVELEHVALLDGADDVGERLQVVLEQQVGLGHVAAQHVDGQQVDEYDLLVLLVASRTVLERVLEVGGGRLVVVVEHGLAAHVELVDDLVRLGKVLLEAAVLDDSLERIAQVDLVDLEVQLEELIDNVLFI